MNGLSDVKRTLNGRYAVADGGRTADRRWSDFEEKTFDDMGRKSISWISTYVCSKNIQNFDMAHVAVHTMVHHVIVSLCVTVTQRSTVVTWLF